MESGLGLRIISSSSHALRSTGLLMNWLSRGILSSRRSNSPLGYVYDLSIHQGLKRIFRIRKATSMNTMERLVYLRRNKVVGRLAREIMLLYGLDIPPGVHIGPRPDSPT